MGRVLVRCYAEQVSSAAKRSVGHLLLLVWGNDRVGPGIQEVSHGENRARISVWLRESFCNPDREVALHEQCSGGAFAEHDCVRGQHKRVARPHTRRIDDRIEERPRRSTTRPLTAELP